MKKFLSTSALVLLSAYGLTGLTSKAQADTIQTTVTFNNATSSPVSLIGKINISGTASPGVPTTIPANGTSGPILFTTDGVVDAGTLQYKSCSFHWGTLENVDPVYGTVTWTLTPTAYSNSSCSATVTTANYFTGQHAVVFTVKN